MHLEIKLTKLAPETVDSAVVNKLYDLYHNRQSGDTFDLLGYIKTGAIFRNVETELETAFQDLEIEPNDYYMTFEDSEVERVLKLNMDKDENEGITATEAAVANLGTWFKNNTSIRSFEEFKEFKRHNTTVDFSGCSNLERIDITNCTTMPNFSDCSSLAYFNGPNSVQGVMMIPEGITSIGNGKLAKCASITELHFPDSFTTLESDSCRQMTNLTKIYFGSGIQTCSNPFYGDDALSEVHIPDIDTWLDIAIGYSAHSSPLTKAHHLYVDGVEITSVDFTGRTSVGTMVLSGGTSITSVVLPSTITSIGASAFDGCSNLVIQDLNLPNLTSLGSSAFSGTKVQTISDLGSITSIPDSCFNNCKQLTSINMPSSLTSIGKNAFSGCSGLTSVTIPNSVTSISGQAFYSCTALTSITIPDNVTSDVQEWFHSCGALTTVVLGSGITRIKAFAFRNDRALRSLTVKAVTPPVCENNALEQSAIVGLYNNYCDIYVPAGSVDAYKTADGWSAAASRIQAIPNS